MTLKLRILKDLTWCVGPYSIKRKFLNQQVELRAFLESKKNIYEFTTNIEIEVREAMIIGKTGDLQFLDNRVSRQHCKIRKHFLGHWVLEDLKSTNGTFIRRGKMLIRLMEGEWKLQKEDIIILANYHELQVL